jgi:hypothetical protein
MHSKRTWDADNLNLVSLIEINSLILQRISHRHKVKSVSLILAVHFFGKVQQNAFKNYME